MTFSVFVFNIAAAFVMGAAIGLERQFRHHSAGFRTNGLVCLGAALFVAVSKLVGDPSTTRIAGQVVSGIGFLGGGVILHEGLTIKGMNTAATLWCTAAVGTLVGAGFPLHGLIGTVLVIGLHLGLRPLDLRIDAHMRMAVNVETIYRMRLVCGERQEEIILRDPRASRRLAISNDDPTHLR